MVTATRVIARNAIGYLIESERFAAFALLNSRFQRKDSANLIDKDCRGRYVVFSRLAVPNRQFILTKAQRYCHGSTTLQLNGKSLFPSSLENSEFCPAFYPTSIQHTEPLRFKSPETGPS